MLLSEFLCPKIKGDMYQTFFNGKLINISQILYRAGLVGKGQTSSFRFVSSYNMITQSKPTKRGEWMNTMLVVYWFNLTQWHLSLPFGYSKFPLLLCINKLLSLGLLLHSNQVFPSMAKMFLY